MKNLFKKVIFFLAISLGLYACTEDYFEFDKLNAGDWNPSLAIPLMSSNLSLADIIVKKDTSGEINVTANGGLQIVFKTSVLSSDSSTVINIPSQTFNESFSVGTAIPAGPPFNNGQKLNFNAVTDLKILDSSRFGVEVDSMTLKSGTLAFTLENSFPYEVEVTAKFRTFTDSLGDTLVLNYLIPAAKPDSVIRSKRVDLKGYQINLSEDKDGNEAINTIPIDLNYSVQLESGVASDANDRLEMDGQITNIDFTEFYGSLGSNPLPLEKDSIAIDFFKNFQEFTTDAFFISNPTLKLTAKNSFSCPMQFEFLELNAYNPNRNPSVIEFDIPSGLQPLSINYPSKYGMVETVFELNRNNSNLDSILSHLTKAIAFDSEAKFNPDGIPPRNGQRRNFITDTSDLGLDLEFIIPFEGKAQGFFIEDTISISGLADLEDVGTGTLRIYAENGFPMDVDLQITFLDDNNIDLGKLILPSNPIYSNGYGMILPSAPTKIVGGQLEAEGNTATITDLIISEERLSNIVRGTKIALSARLSTSGNGGGNSNVVFQSSNRLSIVIALNANLAIIK
ncbi:MAG: hypothetical protein ACI9DK_001237 [Vicingaceae bacterium]|jgi:hypothetical protein